MPANSPIPEADLWELDAMVKEMQDTVALNQRVYEAAEKALGEVARRFYPGIANWEPEQLRYLADRLSRHACNFCQELENMSYESEKAQQQG